LTGSYRAIDARIDKFCTGSEREATMMWWAFNLMLDDGEVLEWQSAGKSTTDAIRELVYCWIERLGDAAAFEGTELVAVECVGLFVGEKPDEATSEEVTDDDLEVYKSNLGDSSKLIAVKLHK
jgi:hypothetical protein